MIPVTLALKADAALSVTYAASFADEVRLIGLPPGVAQDRSKERKTFDARNLGGKAVPEDGADEPGQSSPSPTRSSCRSFAPVSTRPTPTSRSRSWPSPPRRWSPRYAVTAPPCCSSTTCSDPASVTDTVRDLTLRNPGLAVMVVTTSQSAATYRAALDAGARGVLEFPFGLEDVNHRLGSVLEWAQTLRAAMTDSPEASARRADRGARVIAIAGAKGGVGTTVIAAHLAWDVVRSDPNIRVCLVDLAVENGDVPSYLDVAHRVSIADLAKISEDLTPRAVSDTVVVHTSGLHLLLAPPEIRDTEFVTPEAVRRILAQLRGSTTWWWSTPVRRSPPPRPPAVETADITLQVVTADVPALRAARRQIVAWESLGVVPRRGPEGRGQQVRPAQRDPAGHDRQLVLGRAFRGADTRSRPWAGTGRQQPDPGRGPQPDLVEEPARIGRGARRLPLLPASGRGLRHDALAERCQRVAQRREFACAGGVGSTSTSSAPGSKGDAGDRTATNGQRKVTPKKRSRAKQKVGESGQASLETVLMMPAVVLVVMICLQFLVLGSVLRLVRRGRHRGGPGRLAGRQPECRGERGSARLPAQLHDRDVGRLVGAGTGVAAAADRRRRLVQGHHRGVAHSGRGAEMITVPRLRAKAGERGSAALEAAVLIPLAMGVLVVIVQIFAMAYASHGVSQAARDGARAYSLGQSPQSAAAASLPSGGLAGVGVHLRARPRRHRHGPGTLHRRDHRSHDQPIGDDAVRREFSRGFARLQTNDKSEIVADDAQVNRFKQLLLDEVDLQELTRLAPRNGEPGWNGCWRT